MLTRFTLGLAAMMTGIVVLGLFVTRTDENRLPVPTGEKGPAGLTAFYQQKLTWSTCGGAFCTWVKVPIDYAKPSGSTIRLRVKLRPAESEKPKGVLFVNPGGPGGSGVDYVDAFAGDTSRAVRSAYEIFGFDPRGVGQSSPIRCLSDRAFDKFNRMDPDPDDLEEIKNLESNFTSIGRSCVKNSRAVASHMSTAEVARDMDIVRALVGEKSLNYYGASYGTQLGATYATMFPGSVGVMVLDGGVDPTLSKERQGRGQASSFERGLRSFLKKCVDAPNCPLGSDRPDAEMRIVKLLRELDASPMETRGKRKLSENAAVYGIAYALYSPKTWEALTTALERSSVGDGTELLGLADRYFGRNQDGTYRDNGSQAVLAVRCLDYPKAPTRARVLGLVGAYVDASPVFGRAMAWTALECADWPVRSTAQEVVSAKGAPTILVIGTTKDPVTPYAWSKSLTQQLASAVLVTRHGDGHTGYGVGNPCVDDVVSHYLLSGKSPDSNVDCPQPASGGQPQ